MFKKLLECSKVRRGGVTESKVRKETDKVTIVCTNEGVVFIFHIDSKGGGRTHIELKIGNKDFPAILRCMSEFDRQKTLLSMLDELKFQSSKQPDREIDMARKARESALDEMESLARNKMWDSTEDDREKLVFMHREVREMSEKLRKKK